MKQDVPDKAKTPDIDQGTGSFIWKQQRPSENKMIMGKGWIQAFRLCERASEFRQKNGQLCRGDLAYELY